MARRLWRLLLALAVVAALLLAAPYALRAAAMWLFVEDPLQRSPVIAVFAGHIPFRAAEAAALYREGWAPEVWLTRAGPFQEDAALAELGIVRLPEHEYDRQVLRRLGVPEPAIRVLDESHFSTADEVRTIARILRAQDADRVILVTSKYHSRRVRTIWRALTRNRPEAIVRYPRADPFKADRWWRNTDAARQVTREWFGLLNVWLGFPIESRRR